MWGLIIAIVVFNKFKQVYAKTDYLHTYDLYEWRYGSSPKLNKMKLSKPMWEIFMLPLYNSDHRQLNCETSQGNLLQKLYNCYTIRRQYEPFKKRYSMLPLQNPYPDLKSVLRTYDMKRIARAKYILGRPTHKPVYNKINGDYKKFKRDKKEAKSIEKSKEKQKSEEKDSEKDKSEETVTVPTSSTIMSAANAICPTLARCKNFHFRTRDESQQNKETPNRKYLLLLN